MRTKCSALFCSEKVSLIFSLLLWDLRFAEKTFVDGNFASSAFSLSGMASETLLFVIIACFLPFLLRFSIICLLIQIS